MTEAPNRISLEDNSDSLLPTDKSKMSEGQGTTESATQDQKGGAPAEEGAQPEGGAEQSEGGQPRHSSCRTTLHTDLRRFMVLEARRHGQLSGRQDPGGSRACR